MERTISRVMSESGDMRFGFMDLHAGRAAPKAAFLTVENAAVLIVSNTIAALRAEFALRGFALTLAILQSYWRLLLLLEGLVFERR